MRVARDHTVEKIGNAYAEEENGREIVVREGHSGDEDPRNQLREISQNDEKSIVAESLHNTDAAGHQCPQAGPCHKRVGKGINHAACFRGGFEIIQNGFPVEDPLIPIGRKGMGRIADSHFYAMIVIHRLLVFPKGFPNITRHSKKILEKIAVIVRGKGVTGGQYIRDIASHI